MRHCLVMLFPATLGWMFATVLHLQQLVSSQLSYFVGLAALLVSFDQHSNDLVSLRIVRKEQVSFHHIVCATLKTCADFCNRGV